MSDPTPGQVCYAAYWHALAPAHGGMPLAPFAAMGAVHQAAWDAAAQAVRQDYKQALATAWQQGQEERKHA